MDDKSKDINTNSDDKGAPTASGGIAISSNSSKFYNSSIYFDGSNDYLNWGLTSLGTDDMDFGSGDFCLEGWANITKINTEGPLVTKWHGSTSNQFDWRIYCDDTKIYGNFAFGGSDTTVIDTEFAALTNPKNEWFHWALTRDGNTVRFFLNGRVRKTTTVSGALDNDYGSLTFGFFNKDSNNRYFNGYQQDFRAYKGTPKYTQDFVIPVRNSWEPKNIHVTTGSKQVPLSLDDVSISRTGGNSTNSGTVADVFDGSTSTGIQDSSSDQSELIQTINFPNGFGSAASDGAYYMYMNGSDNCNGTGRCGYATTNNDYGGSGWKSLPDSTDWHTWSNQGYGGTPSSISKKANSSNPGSWGNNTILRGFRMGTSADNVWILGQYPLFTKTLTSRHMDTSADSPSNYEDATGDTGVGGQLNGNYCVLNPLNATTNTKITEGGKYFAAEGSNQWKAAVGTFGMSSGKWYWEMEVVNSGDHQTGIVNRDHEGHLPNHDSDAIGNNGWAWTFEGNSGKKRHNNTAETYGNSITTGDVLGIAFDADNGKIWFAKNNTWQDSGNPVTGADAAYTGLTSGPYFPAQSGYTNAKAAFNWGDTPFKYTAPTGFKCLCSQNLLPAAGVKDSRDGFDIKLYKGTGATHTRQALKFQPELTLIKRRNGGATGWRLFDTIRGATKRLDISNNNAESTASTALTAWTSDGFTLGADGGVNDTGSLFVSWNWDAGTAGAANNDGSINVTNQWVNSGTGFSITKYVSNNTAGATVGHGLGAAPEFIWVKNTEDTNNWNVYHKSLGNTHGMALDSNGAPSDDASLWNDTSPTSSVFSIGNGNGVNNASSHEYMAYCWTSIPQFSAFGKYTGNNNANGPMITLDFAPRFIIFKRGASGGWEFFDFTRGGYMNPTNEALYAHGENEEGASNDVDFLSNGFKVRNTGTDGNADGATYYYAAWAQYPFGTTRAR